VRALRLDVALLAGVLLTTACSSTIHADPVPRATSCSLPKPGSDHSCGAQKDADCCASAGLPGGTYNRLNDPRYPATVSPFLLDMFEATNGRLRAFVGAYPLSRPQPGDGAHPKIAGSGWDSSWDAMLPATEARSGRSARLRRPAELSLFGDGRPLRARHGPRAMMFQALTRVSTLTTAGQLEGSQSLMKLA
jgi:hypothetical protein